jgi:hypothetical protein
MMMRFWNLFRLIGRVSIVRDFDDQASTIMIYLPTTLYAEPERPVDIVGAPFADYTDSKVTSEREKEKHIIHSATIMISCKWFRSIR